jgi:hypothetical protein
VAPSLTTVRFPPSVLRFLVRSDTLMLRRRLRGNLTPPWPRFLDSGPPFPGIPAFKSACGSHGWFRRAPTSARLGSSRTSPALPLQWTEEGGHAYAFSFFCGRRYVSSPWWSIRAPGMNLATSLISRLRTMNRAYLRCCANVNFWDRC